MENESHSNGAVKTGASLERRIRCAQHDLATCSPVAGQHVVHGMTGSEACKAAIQHGDNTAANLLIRMPGGAAAVTAFTGVPEDWEVTATSALAVASG